MSVSNRGRVRLGLTVVCLALVAASAQAGMIVVDYTTLGMVNAPSVMLNGTTVTGSSNVTAGLMPALGSTGLGIAGHPGGGFNGNASLDLGESMTIAYGGPVTNVTLNVFDIEPPGNVIYGFEAFSIMGSLGFFALPTHVVQLEMWDITATVGGAPITALTLSSSESAPLGLIIEQTTYDRATGVPGPPTLWLLALGLAALVARRRRDNN